MRRPCQDDHGAWNIFGRFRWARLCEAKPRSRGAGYIECSRGSTGRDGSKAADSYGMACNSHDRGERATNSVFVQCPGNCFISNVRRACHAAMIRASLARSIAVGQTITRS
jgi:hypothetical protein